MFLARSKICDDLRCSPLSRVLLPCADVLQLPSLPGEAGVVSVMGQYAAVSWGGGILKRARKSRDTRIGQGPDAVVLSSAVVFSGESATSRTTC